MVKKIFIRIILPVMFCMAGVVAVFAQDKNFPDRPAPPRLVNDFANMMSAAEQQQLESELVEFERATSNEITIVTITSIGEYDIADYTVKLGKLWGVGKSGRNNGVVILAAAQEHKIWIATGQGLEGALTDFTCGKIRDKMKPYFQQKKFYEGFSVGAESVLAATRGEFKGDESKRRGERASGNSKSSKGGLIIIVIFIVLILAVFGRRGGGGRGGRGGGIGDIATGMILGSLLGGGRGSGSSWGNSGGGDSGGGFGGFGGGDFGGGGAGGSWG
ncbi:MAG: TPM domain-containing protein [Taibaiella sp.]|nr:TPM domain-containing protein [Taibaiella sp.]